MTPVPDAPTDEALMASLRSVLIGQERERIRDIARQAEALQAQVRDLIAALESLQRQADATRHTTVDLRADIDWLRQVQADTEALLTRIKPALSNLIGQSIRDSRDEMAEALGPVMGEAIRVQIRDSRKDMVEALYPIIGETVQRAIGEFARELQRNIDARLRSTFGPAGALRSLTARLRGVSPAQLALRDAMPFDIREIFVVQRESGLLIAHAHPGNPDATDSDLISGMLTAIRDFARDSFGQGDDEELDEVQYGDQRIMIQSGRTAYAAVVATGVEPEGFRARLREIVSDLHVRHEKTLRGFNGDPATLPNLQPALAQLVTDTVATAAASKPMGRKMRLALAGGGLLLIVLIGLGCFYLRFTLALLPVAFPNGTPTHTLTPAATRTSTVIASPTASSTAVLALTPTPTDTPAPAATPTPRPTVAKVSVSAQARGNVWTRPQPDADAPLLVVLRAGTAVTVLAVYDEWAEVEWGSTADRQHGWVPLRWIEPSQPIPPGVITPTPVR